MCFYACNSTDDLQGPTAGTKALSKVIDVTHHDGHPFSTGKSMTTTTGKYVANPGGVMILLGCTCWRKLVEYSKYKKQHGQMLVSVPFGFLRCLRHKTAHFLWDMILLIILILETTIKMEL
jgi:hypothetical protein